MDRDRVAVCRSRGQGTPDIQTEARGPSWWIMLRERSGKRETGVPCQAESSWICLLPGGLRFGHLRNRREVVSETLRHRVVLRDVVFVRHSVERKRVRLIRRDGLRVGSIRLSHVRIIGVGENVTGHAMRRRDRSEGERQSSVRIVRCRGRDGHAAHGSREGCKRHIGGPTGHRPSRCGRGRRKRRAGLRLAIVVDRSDTESRSGQAGRARSSRKATLTRGGAGQRRRATWRGRRPMVRVLTLKTKRRGPDKPRSLTRARALSARLSGEVR